MLKHLGHSAEAVTGLELRTGFDLQLFANAPGATRMLFEGDGGGDGGGGGGSGAGNSGGAGDGDGKGGKGDGGGSDDGRALFSKEYVERLRREAATARTDKESLATELGTAKTKLGDYEKAELEKKGELEKALQRERDERAAEKAELTEKATKEAQKSLRVAVRTAAEKAGLIDLDDIKDLDLKDLRMDDEGNVPGLQEQIDNLKEKKPHWFKPAEGGTTTTTTTNGRTVATPAARDDTGKKGDGVNYGDPANKDKFATKMREFGVNV